MRNNLFVATLLFAASSMLTGCEMIGDLMKGSFIAGVIVVIVVIALVLWLIGKAKK